MIPIVISVTPYEMPVHIKRGLQLKAMFYSYRRF